MQKKEVTNNNFALGVVGRPRVGKSQYLKKLMTQALMQNRKIVVYDVNCEHKEFFNEPYIDDCEVFFNKYKDSKNTLFILEEATTFLTTRGVNNQLKKMIIGRRHTNNDFVLVFHGFYFLPTYISMVLDYYTIFKTNDTVDKLDKKVSQKIVKAWEKIMLENSNFANITVSQF